AHRPVKTDLRDFGVPKRRSKCGMIAAYRYHEIAGVRVGTKPETEREPAGEVTCFRQQERVLRQRRDNTERAFMRLEDCFKLKFDVSIRVGFRSLRQAETGEAQQCNLKVFAESDDEQNAAQHQFKRPEHDTRGDPVFSGDWSYPRFFAAAS